MTKLSNTYTATVDFRLTFEEVPTHIVLKNTTNAKLQLTLTTSGFQLLWYRFKSPFLSFSLARQKFISPSTTLSLNLQDYSVKLQNQLDANIVLEAFQPQYLEIEYDLLEQKKVAILQKPLLYQTGFSLKAPLVITPDSVEISGPKVILDTINGVYFKWTTTTPLNADFEKAVALELPHEELKFSQQEVVLKGSVSRFTEKTFVVPITARFDSINNSLKLFPRQVEVICSLPLEDAKQITAGFFEFEVVYNDSIHQGTTALEVQMTKFPKSAKKIRWQPKTVQYLIRK